MSEERWTRQFVPKTWPLFWHHHRNHSWNFFCISRKFDIHQIGSSYVIWDDALSACPFFM